MGDFVESVVKFWVWKLRGWFRLEFFNGFFRIVVRLYRVFRRVVRVVFTDEFY